MTATFPKKSLPTFQTQDQSPQVSQAAIRFSCYNNLPLTSTSYHQLPEDGWIQIGLTQHKAKDASGGKPSREVIKNEITTLLMIFKSK